MTAHGEERNRKQETSSRGGTEFFDKTTGELVYKGAGVSHTRSVYEKWCEGCQQWIQCDGIFGTLGWVAAHEQHKVVTE